MYLILGLEDNGEPAWTHSYVNPDDLYEDLWEIAPATCYMVLLDVKNGIVSGPIRSDVREYPVLEFEDRLQSCDYPKEVLDDYRCDQVPFLVYPNPSADGVIHIGNLYRFTSITRIRICDLSGRYIYDEIIASVPFQKAIFSFDFSGMYILEFHCGDQVFYEKMIVQLE